MFNLASGAPASAKLTSSRPEKHTRPLTTNRLSHINLPAFLRTTLALPFFLFFIILDPQTGLKSLHGTHGTFKYYARLCKPFRHHIIRGGVYPKQYLPGQRAHTKTLYRTRRPSIRKQTQNSCSKREGSHTKKRYIESHQEIR